MIKFLTTPISSGEFHFIDVPLQSEVDATVVNYVIGPDIALHCSIRPREKAIVFNDFLDGVWGREYRMSLPQPGSDHIGLTLLFGDNGLDIVLDDDASAHFARNGGFEFVRSIQSLADIAVRRDIPERRRPAQSRGSAAVSIVTADTRGFMLKLEGVDRSEDRRIVARVDGRVSVDAQLSDLRPDWKSETVVLCLGRHKEGVMVADGMILNVHVDGVAMAQAIIQSSHLGAIDRCNDKIVRGWACSVDDPGLPVVVEVYLNDKFLGAAVADRKRSDLARLNPNFESSGFQFRFPETIFLPESCDTFIRVVYKGSQTDLAHSPWYICRKIEIDFDRQQNPG